MITKTACAAGLLEIEAIVMNARAQLLQDESELFVARLLEARAKLGELVAHLLKNQGAGITELFLAVPSAEGDSGTTVQPDDVRGGQR